MKLLILGKDGEVIEKYEGLNNCKANIDNVKWDGGEMEGIKNDFIVLEDEVETDRISLTNHLKEFYKNIVIEKMKKDCNEKILSGFTSSNGEQYRLNYNDQQNLNQKISLLLLNPQLKEIQLKTKDGKITNHTRDEFISLMEESEKFKTDLISQYRERKKELQELNEIELIKKFNFENGKGG
jgi:hypothetical protein